MARLFAFIVFISALIAAMPGTAQEPRLIEINAIRLYLPEAELRARLGDDVAPLANYARALHAAAGRHWRTAPPSSARGILVAVGIKPGRRSRIWCEAMGGAPPLASLETMQRDLSAVEAPDVKVGPVAFAIELKVGEGPAPAFVEIPSAWTEESRKAGRPLMIPGELFDVIWPD